jgi:aminoglycoside phosphotransferase (APT) family kinase protein
VIEWAASMGLVTSARVLRRATRDFVALPEAKLLVRIAPARAANLARAARETAAGCLLADAAVPAERLAPGHRQPLRIGGAVATVWELVPRTTEQVTPAQLGALARRLHDATADLARRPGTARLDPFGAIHTALGDARRGGAPSASIAAVAERAGHLSRCVGTAAREDPLGWAIVHGDLHAANTVPSVEGPVLVDLELAGSGPRSYDLAATAVAVRRYGAPAGDFEALLDGYGDDPRSWAGFETFCRVYELWVTAWALGQPDPDVVAEGARRAATLGDSGGHRWQLR